MTVHTARIGDIVNGKAPDVLEALALGSCVAVVLYDPSNKIGSLSHILLPESGQFREIDNIGKFADTAIPEAIRLTIIKGAAKDRLRAKIAGGARMFSQTGLHPLTIDVGARNVEAVKKHLKENDIIIVGDDTGENFGRTITFDLETSIMTIKIGSKKITRHI